MAPSLETGGVVAGYRIEKLLGRGGMAAVYLAEDPRLKRKVALKVLAPELADDEAFRRRFITESERLASVDHPNIIPIYEAGEDGDLLFIAMRYVDSTDLKQLIVSEGGLPPERAISIVTQVAGALDAAHARGLVHRDVKPANILVAAGSGGEHAYLSDFGLTKRTQESSGLTKTGHLMGTIDYVAPEQISGKGVDARTDQYALACVLFECLTGHPPYPKDDDAAVLFSHISEPPPKVTTERPLLPQELDDVVATGMAKDKDERFPTCLELANAARSALAGTATEDAAAPRVSVPPKRSVVALPVSSDVETIPRVRKRLLVGVAAGVVALGLAIGGFLLLGGDEGNQGGGAAAGSGARVTVVALDANTGKVLTERTDDAFTQHLWRILRVEDGSLWQATESSLVRRDPVTGEIQDTIPIPAWQALDSGFGYIWTANHFSPGLTEIDRISPLSGQTRSMRVDGDLVDMRTGNGAVWLLTSDGNLQKIDPISRKVVATYDTGAVTPGAVVPIGAYVWICECESGHIAQFDPRKGEIVQRLELPQHGFIFGVDSTSPDGERVWLLDPDLNTLTPIDPTTGEVGASIGVGGARITDATIAGGAMWVSSQTEVTKIDLDTFQQHIFPVPDGVSAGSVAPTPDGSLVWVANCGCPIQT